MKTKEHSDVKSRLFLIPQEEVDDALHFLRNKPYQPIVWETFSPKTILSYPMSDYARVSYGASRLNKNPLVQIEIALQMKFTDPEIDLRRFNERKSLKKIRDFQEACMTARSEDAIKKLIARFLKFQNDAKEKAQTTSDQLAILFPRDDNPFLITRRLLTRALIRSVSTSRTKLIALEDAILTGKRFSSESKHLFWGDKLCFVFEDQMALYREVVKLTPYEKLYGLLKTEEQYYKKALLIERIIR